MILGNGQQHQKDGSKVWGLMGLAALPLLCCGMPLLLGALGMTTIGALLVSSRYWILGAVVLLIGLVMFFTFRKGKKDRMNACFAVPTSQDSTAKGER